MVAFIYSFLLIRNETCLSFSQIVLFYFGLLLWILFFQSVSSFYFVHIMCSNICSIPSFMSPVFILMSPFIYYTVVFMLLIIGLFLLVSGLFIRFVFLCLVLH